MERFAKYLMIRKKILTIILTTLAVVVLTTGCRSGKTAAEAESETEPFSEFPSDLYRITSEAEEIVEEIPLLPLYSYSFVDTKPVDGRQGIAWARGDYYISGNQFLTHYDWNWNVVNTCKTPFEEIEEDVNHISDIDIYRGELFAGVECFRYPFAYNFMIAVYDASTFELKRTYPIAKGSGLREISGITVDPDTNSLWLSSWVNERTGEFVYRYDLETGEYLGRFHLNPPIRYAQGISYYKGSLFFTADDGDAEEFQPDHLYRCVVDLSKIEFDVVEECEFENILIQGEMEGLDFDPQHNRILISYNRGVLVPYANSDEEYEKLKGSYHGISMFALDFTE